MLNLGRGRRNRHHMVVTNTYAISAYQGYEFESSSWQGVFDTTLCDKVCCRKAKNSIYLPQVTDFCVMYFSVRLMYTPSK
jgi:hypothetical protein